EVNKSYENNTLQQIEQTNMDIQTQLKVTSVVDNEDSNIQSWAEIMDNDSDNVRDITNATNPWVTPSTNETSSTSTNREIENAQEPTQYSNHENENMQAEVTQQEATAELVEGAINMKNTHDVKVETPAILADRSDEEMAVDPSDTSKVTQEEDTHEEAVETPTNNGISPDEEMAVEPSDPLRDELLNLYGTTENKENLLPVAATKDINVKDVQASMFSQVSNAEIDDFKVVIKIHQNKESNAAIVQY
ncbi:37082_t:CDS:2, partial [Gigaspora margarita]